MNNWAVILIGIGVLLTTVGYLYLYTKNHRVIELVFALGSMLLGGILSATASSSNSLFRLLPGLLFFSLLVLILVLKLTHLVPPTHAIHLPRLLLVALLVLLRDFV